MASSKDDPELLADPVPNASPEYGSSEPFGDGLPTLIKLHRIDNLYAIKDTITG